jgi:uncharacterized membrane protein YjfL (UPF0719 family)
VERNLRFLSPHPLLPFGIASAIAQVAPVETSRRATWRARYASVRGHEVALAFSTAGAPLGMAETMTSEVTERVSAFRWAHYDVAAVVTLALVPALADVQGVGGEAYKRLKDSV